MRFFLLALLGIPSILISQNKTFCNQLSSITELIEKYHISPKILNDSTSKHIHDLFISKIDTDHLFFLEEDISSFQSDVFLLDDYISSNDCKFISRYINVLNNRIDETIAILENTTNQTLDYSGKSTIHFDASKARSIFKDNKDRRDYWNKYLRYRILNKLVDTDSSLSYIQKHFKTIEAEYKSKVVDQEICTLTELKNQNNGIEDFVKNQFLDALLNVQDPNSTYFNSTEKQNFEREISNIEYTYGIITKKSKTGSILIAHIIPGSPAHKNGIIAENDEILSLKSDENTLEINCISNESVMSYLNAPKNKSIELQVKQEDGSLKSITLSKSKISVERNTIEGYIINNDNKLGYIKIPSFYTDTETFSGNGVSNDVANELYKLNKENIEGLIIDLRSNGGGSMQEAINLSGLFIDRGPVGISKVKSENNYTFRDPNRGRLFNKPIVIIINAFSASASELFTNALKDYNIATVVGQKSFGKGTSQIILPVKPNENMGFVKLTSGIFFGIDGKTHQKKGITPDIPIPSFYQDFEIGERYKTHSIKNDTVNPTLNYKVYSKINLTDISERSHKRILQNDAFKNLLVINNELLKNFVKRKTQYPLTLTKVFEDRKKRQAIWKSFSNFDALQEETLNVKNTTSNLEVLSYNTEAKLENENYLKKLSKDIILKEASYILSDILQTNSP